MHWANWQEFWAMGGHGLYVWSAYAVTLAVVVTEVVVLLVKRRSILYHLGRLGRLQKRGPDSRLK